MRATWVRVTIPLIAMLALLAAGLAGFGVANVLHGRVWLGGGALNMSRDTPARYSRPYTVLITTAHGDWVAHCHDYHDPYRYARIYGGCVKPERI